jgi:adenylate cyclase class IV
MIKNQIELEIKSLLGEKEAMESLISRMREIYPKMKLKRKNKQLNHYFTKGNLEKLQTKISSYLSLDQKVLLRDIVATGKSHSVRTRKADDDVLLVVKATLDESTSSNGITRTEFEVHLPTLTLDALDSLLLDSDFEYQAKWSRERQEYLYKQYSVSIDKNAGYGYLAEFERILNPTEDFVAIKNEIRREFEMLGIQELPQDRLERMFDFYNKNWRAFYGTEKTFIVQ